MLACTASITRCSISSMAQFTAWVISFFSVFRRFADFESLLA
jgi:hypothetical protein